MLLVLAVHVTLNIMAGIYAGQWHYQYHVDYDAKKSMLANHMLFILFAKYMVPLCGMLYLMIVSLVVIVKNKFSSCFPCPDFILSISGRQMARRVGVLALTISVGGGMVLLTALVREVHAYLLLF